MYEIKCPKCGEVFQVEKAAYAEIVEQVRNEQFAAEVETRVEALKQLMETKEAARLLAVTTSSGERRPASRSSIRRRSVITLVTLAGAWRASAFFS